MGDTILPLIIVLIILVIFSGYFSATETAFSTLNKIRVKNWANNGNKRAILIMKIENDFDKFITNVLVGNNIVNILATTLATILFTQIWVDASFAATMTTVIMTLTILTFGEILPKTLAKRFPEKFAMFSAPIIKMLSYLFYPLSIIFILMQRVGKKVLKPQHDSVTDEELITIIDEAESSGGLDKDNSELIRSAVEFNDVEVDKIFTPRVDIIAVEKNANMEQIFNTFKKSGFSRLPVYEKNIDNIVGFIHEKDFFFAMHEGKVNIADIIQPIQYTQPQVKVDDLLKSMQRSKIHQAVVLDEFGGTEGIVTLEDCIEELVGEIYDESDDIETPFQKVSEKEYIVKGSVDLDDFFDYFKIKKDKNVQYDANSVGGWVSEYLGLLPNKGVVFEYKKIKVEILEIVKHRIRKVKITKL